MTTAPQIIFFIAFFLLVHSYLIYPLILWVLAKHRAKKYLVDPEYTPKVSILISIYNEEKFIETTLRTFSQLNYDPAKIEIIVGSDHSTDNSNQILSELSKEFKNLCFVSFSERRGKTFVLDDLVKMSTSDILIFSDANTIYDKDAVRHLVKYYKDERIGGVSGRLRLMNLKKAKDEGSHEKTYWEYETFIKNLEGKLGILIGANGGIYSIRKKCYHSPPKEFNVSDDFFISMKVFEQKLDVTYSHESFADEYVLPSILLEFKRKIRVTPNVIKTISAISNILSPSFGLISLGLWSHKVIRWATPLLMIVILLTNALLINSGEFYKITFIAQMGFYLLAFVGLLLSLLKINITLFSMCFYFVITNAALMIGIYKMLIGRHTAFWKSSGRIQ